MLMLFSCAGLIVSLTGCGIGDTAPKPTRTIQPLGEACEITSGTLSSLDEYVSATVSSITVGNFEDAATDMSTAAGLAHSARSNITRDELTASVEELRTHIHNIGQLIAEMRETRPTTLEGWNDARTTIDDAVTGINKAGADIDGLCMPH